ncbi:MAG: helix-turn-helix domain-containing protein [Acidobacteria bacterium]|jgi:excisionase family DNA binding protein|nr:helix-turn-helix domain-containing protein [Acidobacteriota bacterium]
MKCLVNFRIQLDEHFFSLYFIGMKVLTTREASERLNVSVRRVHQFIKQGRLPAAKLGRDYVIQEKDLSLVAERKNGRPVKKESTKE